MMLERAYGPRRRLVIESPQGGVPAWNVEEAFTNRVAASHIVRG